MSRLFRGRLRDRFRERVIQMTWDKIKPVLVEIAKVAAVAIAAYFGFRLTPVQTQAAIVKAAVSPATVQAVAK